MKLIPPSGCQQNDFVIYYADKRPSHSGIWKDGIIESHWGNVHVWEHAIHEVPFRYGHEVKFFKGVKVTKCLNAFIEYARKEIGNNRGRQSKLNRIINLYTPELQHDT